MHIFFVRARNLAKAWVFERGNQDISFVSYVSLNSSCTECYARLKFIQNSQLKKTCKILYWPFPNELLLNVALSKVENKNTVNKNKRWKHLTPNSNSQHSN